MNRIQKLAFLALALVAITGWGLWLGDRIQMTGQAHAIAGSVELTDSRQFVTDGSCLGIGDWSDIAPGADVVLRDEAGTILGRSGLSDGAAIAGRCRFTFTFSDIPDGVAYYSVEVSHRGEIVYPHDMLARQQNWTLDLLFFVAE
jgi:hypothetical protein